jgi:hypothetical protein
MPTPGTGTQNPLMLQLAVYVFSGITTGFVTPSGYDLGKVIKPGAMYASPNAFVPGMVGIVTAMAVDKTNNII